MATDLLCTQLGKGTFSILGLDGGNLMRCVLLVVIDALQFTNLITYCALFERTEDKGGNNTCFKVCLCSMESTYSVLQPDMHGAHEHMDGLISYIFEEHVLIV